MTGLLKWAAAAFGASLTMGALAGGVSAAGPAASNNTTTNSSTTCNHSGNDLVEDVTYTTGSGTFSSMTGHVAPGDHLVVSFTVPANCSVVLSLVSYQAPAATFDPATASQQTVFDSKDGVSFGPGDHSLAVNIPACFFQVDFVRGTVIQHLGPKGSNNFYDKQDRLISFGRGGTTACGSGSVSGVTTTPTPGGQGNVKAITTPSVGANPAIGLAAVLAILGLVLVVAGRRRDKVV